MAVLCAILFLIFVLAVAIAARLLDRAIDRSIDDAFRWPAIAPMSGARGWEAQRRAHTGRVVPMRRTAAAAVSTCSWPECP